MEELTEKLEILRKSDEYPLHMPGHKRLVNDSILEPAYGIDITEIEGYDNLYEAEGILKEAMDRAAEVFGAQKTWFLVNGSTVGILTAITALTKPGDKVLVARNCHKAVYHAMQLRELQADYLYPRLLPEWNLQGSISPQDVKEALETEEYAAVIITSPTYEGIVSDVAAIAEIAHEKKIPFLVDEAHGAHFSFHKRFPKSAVAQGADVVVQSLHKTLPALTQTALLHLNGALIDYEKIGSYLSFYQTSSPSYVLMSSIDECVGKLQREGKNLWNTFFLERDLFDKRCEALERFRIFQADDPCKLVISTKNTNITGRELQIRLLKEYHIQIEMAASDYILGIVTMNDTKEGFDRIYQALSEIDKTLTKSLEEDQVFSSDWHVKTVCTLSEAKSQKTKAVSLHQSIGRTAGDFVNVYPPGIPILVPGEEITEEIVRLLEQYQKQQLHVQGITENQIEILSE